MKLKDIYLKDIERPVNPAVSASDFSANTVKTEIEEYVFTDEIINGLFKILSAIQSHKFSHNGIWINGYFGSGKSHFLKYLGYCMHPEYRDFALERLEKAVEEADPLKQPESKSEVSISEMRDVALWLKSAKIDTILFNIGTVHNVRGNEKQVFLDVFWSEFNSFRGYNKFNLALAQHFEKVLDEKGQFEAFKERMQEDGFDWSIDAADLAINELDYILEVGKELVPTLSTDIIRERIAKDDTHVSVETFCNELKAYLNKQEEKYRLIFLVDEVSQFIDSRKGLLLQLQEIVTRLHETCDDKVWITATAQQDLQEILQSCQINETSEDYGKIMGRFEVKVSLTGTKPEFITQKRILDKNGTAGIELGKLYEQKRNAISAQFQLPNSYKSFENKEEFIDYYPLVPYQFRLIMQVFNSFVNLGFVEKEVKGNERSIIKVTHSTARQTKELEVGNFISFDQFFGPMFKGALVAKGQKAIHNANKMIDSYEDKAFGQRIVNILFMICNLSQTDKLLFPATVDNITCLLMSDVDTQKLALKEKVKKVLDYLCDNNIIRTEESKPGVPVSYCFYSEDETEVAQLIKSQTIDNNTMAEELKEIFSTYINPQPRESYFTGKFSVGASIMGKNFLINNADINIEFVMDADCDTAEQYAFGNTSKVMAFFMADLYKDMKQLKNDFYWYCQVQTYMRNNKANTELRGKTHEEFKNRAKDLYTSKIEKPFREMFDKCKIVIGSSTLSVAELGSLKGHERYRKAMEKHLANVYPYASLVKGITSSSEELKRTILSPVSQEHYKLYPMTEAELQVDNYLSRSFPEMNVKDLVLRYAAAPYGWNEVCTLYILDELVRRRVREFVYNNNPHVEKQIIANNLMKDQQKFTIRAAQKISQEIVNDFISSWKDIFGISEAINPDLDVNEIHTKCKDTLEKQQIILSDIYSSIRTYPFAVVIEKWQKMVSEWMGIRDVEMFLKRITSDRIPATEQMDKCKQVREFHHDQIGRYKEFVTFVKENELNFGELTGCDESIRSMRTILTDEWPIDNMPYYKKLRDELRFKLEELKKELRSKIKVEYTKTVETLFRLAENNEVQYGIQADAVIIQKSQPDNILALKNNLDTAAFYEQEAAKIMAQAASAKPKTVPGKEEPSQPATKPVRQVKLSTRTVHKICSEQDVDTYLQTLKQQLMDHISKGEELIIL